MVGNEIGFGVWKSSGAVIGYSNLGISILQDAERQQFKNPNDYQRPLAKVMVFMIHGMFTNMKFVYARFPAASTKNANLFPIFN